MNIETYIDYGNFHHLFNFKFDIDKLQGALTDVLTIEKFNTLDISNFGAIPLNRIPGDPSSVEGHNLRAKYWTIPDSDGKEAERDVYVQEHLYTEFIPKYENTYFKEVYETLTKNFNLGRVRLLLKQPRSCLSWHRDPEPRLHVPIVTNLGCRMVIGDECRHMPADGSVWITNNVAYHNFFNGGEQNRVHIVAGILGYNF
jgi:hypothetical protein